MQQFYRNGRLIEWDPEKPVITCLMSVYNGETYLREAMDSILDQTYTNFEFLIINDGSTDDTVSIIESYDDPRIRLIHNEVNIGLTKSLNKGIDLAKGEYIARMDADDISLPQRFERQLEVIKNDYVVAQKQVYFDYLPDKLIFKNTIIHSSTLFNRINTLNLIVKYDDKIILSQDYELWLREFYNNIIYLDNLVKLRVHENSITQKSSEKQMRISFEVLLNYLESRNVILTESEKKVLYRLRNGESFSNQFVLSNYINIINKMYDNKIISGVVEKKNIILNSILKAKKINLLSRFLFSFK